MLPWGIIDMYLPLINRTIIINCILHLIMHHSLPLPYSRLPPYCDVKSETSTEGEEMQSHDGLSSPIILPYRSAPSKAKSSLCKNFMDRGTCPYAEKCQFAHGPQDLRINMEHNRSYKTKGCHAFAKKGFCCFGDRCNFVHQRAEEVSAEERWARIYSNHRETFQAMWEPSESRLLRLLKLAQ